MWLIFLRAVRRPCCRRLAGEGGETEQPARAEHLSTIGRAQVIREDELEGVALAARVDALIDSGPKRFAPVSCDGAAHSAETLQEYLPA